MHVSVEKDVASILQKYGVDLEEINSVIFSHHHFDHTGDIRRVGQKTKVIVGAGYKKQYLPGWPDNKRKWETTSDLYRDREVVEISFSASDERMRTPFCTATGPHYDVEAAQRSIGMLATFDEMENVFTMLAHDTSLEGVVDLFPASAADWRKEGWKERCQWRFLGGLLGKEEGRRTERSRL